MVETVSVCVKDSGTSLTFRSVSALKISLFLSFGSNFCLGDTYPVGCIKFACKYVVQLFYQRGRQQIVKSLGADQDEIFSGDFV